MFAKAGFLDVSPLYSRKLFSERCLLAIARYQAKNQLEVADKEAFLHLEKLLSNVSEVKDKTKIGSLAADAEGILRVVQVALAAGDPRSTLPELLQYLQGLLQTASVIAKGQKAPSMKVKQLVSFVEILSTNASEEIASITQRRALLTTPA